MPAAGAAADSSDQKGDKGQVRSSTAGRLDGQPLHGTAGSTVYYYNIIGKVTIHRIVPLHERS